MNRTVNPIVRAILRSPAHGVLSRRIALLTITGRTSGRRLTFPVMYRQDGAHVTVNVGAPDRKRWWRNLRDGAAVELRLRGVQRAGIARARRSTDDSVIVDVELET